MRSLALGLILLGACTVESPPDELSSTERAWMDQALPALQQQCVSCHAGNDELGFLAGDNAWVIRMNLLESGEVIVDAPPEESPLLTKGEHAGPHLTVEQQQALLNWLHIERSWR